MRALFLILALSAATALAEPARELPETTGAVKLQEGTVYLLSEDGQVDTVPTRLPAGWWYSVAGHQRLTLAVAQVQADRSAADARAEALQQALQLRSSAPTTRVSTTAVVGLAVLLVLAGGVAGYALAR